MASCPVARFACATPRQVLYYSVGKLQDNCLEERFLESGEFHLHST
jgi:hypothetical protein